MALLVLAACGRPVGGPDAGVDPTDAGADSGVDSGVPDAGRPVNTNLPCDPLAQNCPAATPRCTIDRNQGSRTTACVASTGTVALGGLCAVATNKTDNCAPGGFCSYLGQPVGGTHTCRKICLLNTDCEAGAGCYRFSDNTSPDRFGICLPSCTPLGSDCPTGTNCKPFSTAVDPATLFVCIYPGSALPVGGACTSSFDCGDDMTCMFPNITPPGQCRLTCTSNDPCDGGTCTATINTPITSDGSTPGFCSP